MPLYICITLDPDTHCMTCQDHIANQVKNLEPNPGVLVLNFSLLCCISKTPDNLPTAIREYFHSVFPRNGSSGAHQWLQAASGRTPTRQLGSGCCGAGWGFTLSGKLQEIMPWSPRFRNSGGAGWLNTAYTPWWLRRRLAFKPRSLNINSNLFFSPTLDSCVCSEMKSVFLLKKLLGFNYPWVGFLQIPWKNYWLGQLTKSVNMWLLSTFCLPTIVLGTDDTQCPLLVYTKFIVIVSDFK